MNPERAMHFLCDLHMAGWCIGIGPYYVVATHTTWGAAMGKGEDLAERLDDLRKQLQARELCQ